MKTTPPNHLTHSQYAWPEQYPAFGRTFTQGDDAAILNEAIWIYVAWLNGWVPRNGDDEGMLKTIADFRVNTTHRGYPGPTPPGELTWASWLVGSIDGPEAKVYNVHAYDGDDGGASQLIVLTKITRKDEVFDRYVDRVIQLFDGNFTTIFEDDKFVYRD